MKRLYGILFEAFTEGLSTKPAKHLYSEDDDKNYSIFINGNEFLFQNHRLISCEAQNFSALSEIPEFTFPLDEHIEGLLRKLDAADLAWSIHQKYTRDKWIVIELVGESLLYEFEFEKEQFKLKYVRLKVSLEPTEESPNAGETCA